MSECTEFTTRLRNSVYGSSKNHQKQLKFALKIAGLESVGVPALAQPLLCYRSKQKDSANEKRRLWMDSSNVRKEIPRFNHCNLCEKSYRARGRYERFCKDCRVERLELIRFADWLKWA